MVRAQDKMTRNTTLGLTSEDGHQITSTITTRTDKDKIVRDP